MGQIDLALMGVIDGAKAVPQGEVAKVASYREAVRMAWAHRRSQRMTRQTLAELTGMYPQHVSDYLADDDHDRHGKERRDMPARFIKEFEAVTGNTFVSQWLAYKSGLTVLQGLIAEQKAA
jgi:hypothetical protein